MGRRSLGKGLLNLRPERLDGQPMSVGTSARRNGVFVVSYFSVLPAIGVWASLAGLVLAVYEACRAATDPEGRFPKAAAGATSWPARTSSRRAAERYRQRPHRAIRKMRRLSFT